MPLVTLMPFLLTQSAAETDQYNNPEPRCCRKKERGKKNPSRSSVTSPSDTDWSLEWHEPFHHWNDRARTFAQTAGLKPWSYCVCRQHWKLASHIANLPEHRWVRRILAWNPSVRYRSLGRRAHTWDYEIQAFCRYKGLGPWLEEAKCHHHWTALFEDFCAFCQM